MSTQDPKYNNIFNKKNIEFTLDGIQDRLPYKDDLDVKLKANQIIFTSINNIFQRLLDNDLYNEALLKKYVEYGLIGGPTYVSSISDVENSPILNKKFVVSGENGISVLRKDEVDVSETLSGAFLSGDGGIKVNKVTFINERYVACTENGIFESIDKINWYKRVGNNGIDVIDIAYNQNFLNESIVSAYDYIAVANSGRNISFYGHNGMNNTWVDFSITSELSAVSIKNAKATSIFSFIDDPLLYVGTEGKGLLASELLAVSSNFASELGTLKWNVYDMVDIQNSDPYENYMLATSHGIKQSRKKYGFRNLAFPSSSDYYVFDALKNNDDIYAATGEGLQILNKEGEITWAEGLVGKACHAIIKANGAFYVAADDGVYLLRNGVASRIGLENKSIKLIESFNSSIFAYDGTRNKIVYSKNNSAFEDFSLDLEENDEVVKQFIQHKSALYVVTNKNVYAIVNSEAELVFSWCDSFAQNNNVYFAQNLSDGSIIAQVNGKIVLLQNGNIGTYDIEVDIPEYSSQQVTSAVKAGNEYFLLIDNALYRIFSDEENHYVLDPVLVDQEQIYATAIAFYNDNEFNGIVLLTTDGKITLLQYDESYNTLLPISGTERFKGIITYLDGIYGVSQDKVVTKYSPVSQYVLNKIQDLTADVGVSLQEYAEDLGIITNRFVQTNAYLTAFSDSLVIEVGDYDPFTTELTSFDGPLAINCGDFIGYVNNSDEKRTLLAGMLNNKVKAFNVEFDNDLTALIGVEEISVKNSPESPNAFADVCYRNDDSGIVANAMNFVGAANGLYAISASDNYNKESIPNEISYINDAIVYKNNNEVTAFVGTNAGIYRFEPTEQNNFDNADYGLNVKTLSKFKNLMIANSVGENVLLSSAISKNPAWTPLFVSETGDEFSITGLIDPTDTETTDFDLSSNGGYVLIVSPKTVSFENEEAQRIIAGEETGDISYQSSIDETIIFNQTYDVAFNGEITINQISSIYKEENKFKACDIFGGVHELTFSKAGNNVAITATPLLGASPKTIEEILTNKLANFFTIDDELSLGEELDNIEIATVATNLPNYIETISVANSINLNNVTDANLILATSSYHVPVWNIDSYLCCNEPILSANIEFSDAEINSIGINASIEISSMFLSNVVEYRLEEEWIYPEEGDPYCPTWPEDAAPSVIISPDGQEAQINPGDFISSWVSVPTGEIDVFPKKCLLSESFTITESNKQFVLSDIDALFANDVYRYSVSAGSDVSYKAALSIEEISYRQSASPANSTIDISYILSSTIENSEFLNKNMPLVQETNDGIYYDDIYWNKLDQQEIEGGEIESTIEKNTYAGYCINPDDDLWIMYAENSIYAFDRFKDRTKKETLGFVQIASSISNDNFNDLYYFKVGENFSSYQIRKTLISKHEKDFSFAKYSTDSGSIPKITIEDNTLYVVKENNEGGETLSSLYFTSSNIFPTFSEVEFPVGCTTLIDIDSCNDYTLVAFPGIDDEVCIYPYVDGMLSTGAIVLPDETCGSFENFFHDDSTIYLKTTTGIWHFVSGSTSLVQDLDFTLCSNVRTFFKDNTYDSDIIIGDAYLYAIEKLYNFKDDGYVKISGIDSEIVDIKILSAAEAQPIAYVATMSDIYQFKILGLNSDSPAFSSFEKKNNGIDFSNIKSIYFAKNNDFYVLDGTNLHLYKNFTSDKQLSNCETLESENFLSSNYNKVSFTDFKDLHPCITLYDSINTIKNQRRIIKQSTLTTTGNTLKFIPGIGQGKYLYSSNTLKKLSSDYGIKDFTLNDVGAFGSTGSNLLKNNGPHLIDDRISNKTVLWGVKNNVVKEIEFVNGELQTSSTYDVLGNPTLSCLFYLNNRTYLGTVDEGAGVYKIEPHSRFIIDPNDSISQDAASLSGDRELFTLAFFNDDYLLNYIDRNLLDDYDNVVQRTLFKSNNEEVQNYLNKNYISNSGASIINVLFGRYIFISDGGNGYVYNTVNKTGTEILLSQLEQAVGGIASLIFLKESDGLGFLGYGNLLGAFDGFSNVKIYDDVDYMKYVAIANNFKRGTKKIHVLDKNSNFLIGTTYGLKYVYDDIMTRSFYDKENDLAINEPVNAIEKVIDAGNNELFIIGSGNSLYEVTGLKNTKFRKIHEFASDETVMDVFALQKNEYVISTTKGIYITALKYELINDLRRFTLDNIYEVINDELGKIIANHIKNEHKSNSIITKVNAKADNKLSFVLSEDKHKDLYDATIANSVRVVENDIIDTIVRGGETPDSDSYVKVGIKNWAVNTLNPKATYTDDGFINAFTDATSGKTFDISVVPYIVKNWKSGLKEIYIYVPSTGTYYANNPQGITNSEYSYNAYVRPNVPDTSLLNTLPSACTTLRVYLYNSYFKIKTILAAQCTGNSLPLKIYKDNANADDAWKGVFDTAIQPSALRTLPMTIDSNVNNVRICTDELERIHLDFSIYGTDAQAIRIIAES